MAAVENKAPEETESPEKQQRMPKEVFEPPPLLRAVMTYIGYIVLYAVSLVGDTLRSVGLKNTGHVEVTKKDVGDFYVWLLSADCLTGVFSRTGSR